VKVNRKLDGLGGIALLLAIFAGSALASSEKVLYRFHGRDGWTGSNVIMGPGGKLYGTTWWGGGNACHGSSLGCGLVFGLTRAAGNKWHETVIHSFNDADGFFPNGALLLDKAGNLYGTTVYGGNDGCSGLGCGLVFELVRGTGGKWKEKVLHIFSFSDGSWPYAGLIFDSKGNLYGAASTGGNSSACTGGCGLIFRLAHGAGGKWTETILHSFQGTDGESPLGPLTFDSSGNLDGTTQFGGANGGGTVFELSPGASGGWAETVLHSFSFDTSDGYQPASGVVLDSLGSVYGTTQFGGTEGEQGWGTAFELMPAGNGQWTETILHSFDEHKVGGGAVSSGPVLDDSGNLYGAASLGGKYTCPYGGGLGCGVVFKLVPRADGKWTETVLHSFGKGEDGAGPNGNIFRDQASHLFGVTATGGYLGGACGQGFNTGCGAVFEITP